MTFSRRSLQLVICTLLLCSACAPETVVEVERVVARERPNVILVLTDDLGWGDLGCYGNREIRTPNIDRLAAEGMRFTQFYVAATVCSPSRTGILTGQFPSRLRVFDYFASPELNRRRGMPNWLDPRAPTITRLLQDAGYATGHFGKWHLGGRPGEPAPTPGEYGIDDHVTIVSSGPSFEGQDDLYFRARSTELIVDEAIRFIDGLDGRPFYLNLWTLLPHSTLHPTEQQLEPYAAYAPQQNLPYLGAKQVYYASVTEIDRQMGRLMAFLDERGLAENTLFIFTSDNGPEVLDVRLAGHSAAGSTGPFRGRKRSLYEGGIRMPFVVRWPAHAPANRVNEKSIIAAVDLLPTIANLAGVELPADIQLDGEDVGDILFGADRERRTPLYWDQRFPGIGHPIDQSPALCALEGQWKLLMNPDGSRVELYNLAKDPMEVDNLATENSRVAQRMERGLLEWYEGLPKSPVDPRAGQLPEHEPGKLLPR